MTRLGYKSAASALLVWLASGAAGLAHAACDEVGYIATFEVKPGSEEAFEQAIAAVASKVVEIEEGVVLYAPFRGDNGLYYMMERYRNQQAREAHAKAPEVMALFPAVMDQLSAPIGVEPVSAVCASAD